MLILLGATFAWSSQASLGLGATAHEPARDYVAGAWGSTYFQPKEVQIQSLALINEGSIFYTTRTKILTSLRNGLLAPVLEVEEPDKEKITASHLCHHRNSILFEVQSLEGGLLTIYEYSLSDRRKRQVAEFQEALVPATSLACADQTLLRASPANLLALSLSTGTQTVLHDFQGAGGGASASAASLAVGHAADVLSRARVFAVVPGNRSILRLGLSDEHGFVQLESMETALPAGDGADGPLPGGGAAAAAQGVGASAAEPRLAAWSRGRLLFVDGCAVRQLDDERASTLLGSPGRCADAAEEESLGPVPWAAHLARPTALASGAEATASEAVLVLTGSSKVVRLLREPPSACLSRREEAACAKGSGCGWVEGVVEEEEEAQRSCLACSHLESWLTEAAEAGAEAEAAGEAGAGGGGVCALDGASRAGARYNLQGCGCEAPPPSTQQPPEEPESGIEVAEADGLKAARAGLASLLALGATCCGAYLYRAQRRAAIMQDLYGVDTAEFHTFTDDECLH